MHNVHVSINNFFYSGAIEAGIGYRQLNKIMACVNGPKISFSTFKDYEREVGAAIEKACKESCRRTVKEEREEVIKRVDELRKEL